MIQSPTLSKSPPERNSMNYAALRELGIQRIQELAGALWTDYNSHDPGITMLEVFSYVLTDLGYRVNYDIKDIIAQELSDPDYYDIKNFYTAGQILPNCPVTFNDYRKLLIDVDVYDPLNPDCEHVGVKNAWIEKAQNPPAEHKIFVDRKNSKLSLSPIPGVTHDESNAYYVGVLYNILLEFDQCDTHGDLNSSFSEVEFQVPDPDDAQAFIRIDLRVDFRRWDEEDIDWSAPLNISAHVAQVRLRFPNLPSGSEVVLEGGLELNNITAKSGNLLFISSAFLNQLIPEVQTLFDAYVLKVNKVFEIIDAIKKRLHANRNLCEDFFKLHALKVEEILLCADVELNQQADVESTEAAILHAISDFLSPTVYFYTLEERLNKCNSATQYPLAAITKNKNTLTISTKFETDVNREDTITLFASETNKGEFTVKCIRRNKENHNYTDIEVEEDLTSEEIAEKGYLITGTIDQTLCQSVDEIFEGPKLRNGFIDDEELTYAERRKYIHVSDLVRIIMDIDGVVAVKNIQIANRPQDNEDDIASKSVKWCLELAFKNNYVPRLNIGDSKLTYYKDQLPFIADDDEVATMLEVLQKADRPQKRFHPNSNLPIPIVDIPEPIGAAKDLENYTSLQEDFPLVYGIGSEGIPALSALKGDEKSLRIAQARQLKGYLMFIDQLCANYLSQLHHVKDLFSMNGDKNAFGEFQIDRTYFSQPLLNPAATDDPLNLSPLYVDHAGHLVAMQHIIEDKDLYEKRRNKFLDHLLGRFAESFSDYALLLYKATGPKANAELIEDKLNFLNAYPELSAARGKAFNYLSPCDHWSADNISGLEQRASLLLGMAPKKSIELAFSPNFKITETSGTYSFSICQKPSNAILMNSPTGMLFETIESLNEHLEQLIVVGSCQENYQLVASNNAGTRFSIHIICEGVLMAESERSNFTENSASVFIDNFVENVMLKEFCDNHESNRKNLSMPINNYFEVTGVTANLTPPDNQPPQYEIAYKLYSEPFDFVNKNLLFSGTVLGAAGRDDDEATVIEKGEAATMKQFCDLVAYGTDRNQYATITDDSSDYRFVLCNNRGGEIGRSLDKNFNKIVEKEIDQLDPKSVQVGPLGTFEFNNAVDRGKEVEIRFKIALPNTAVTESVSYTQSFTILAIDLQTRSIEIDLDLNASAVRFYVGDTITIDGSDSNDGKFTLLGFNANGSNTVLHVQQTIAVENPTGAVQISRSYPITKIDGKKVFIKGGEENRAIQTIIDFFINKFASHEGFHLIEHTIIRPRINEAVFLPADAETLTDGITDFGQLFFGKTIPIEAVKADQNVLIVDGDLTGATLLEKLNISGGSPNDGTYHLTNCTFKNGKTRLKVKEDVLFELPADGLATGNVTFYKGTTIESINAANRSIRVADLDAQNIAADDMVIIWKSENTSNDGRYKISSAAQVGPNRVEIRIAEYQGLLQDALLPVNFDDECDTCNIIDPYSCVASVILPYWPGRFTNLDIRNYIEKTIRLEAPAHLMLNICWVNCEHMEAFEKHYKKWLIEIGKQQRDKNQLALALAEFIQSITQLRNIYPAGTLHSCDDDDTFEGSIILNNSVLGTF